MSWLEFRASHGRILALAAAAALACSGAARAEDGDCLGFGALADTPAIGLGRVGQAAPRTYFVRNASDAKGCPAATAACRDKAFLVPGDRVILSATRGGFVCVDYIGAKGADRAGWLPAEAVGAETVSPPGAADWIGTWSTVEAKISIKRGKKPAELAVRGDATFGALDPDRVKRGAVNVGEIEGNRAPQGAGLSFTMASDATLPVDKGDSTDCKVWMRRLGPYLLVDDNNQCGGMNVSFRGVFTRKP